MAFELRVTFSGLCLFLIHEDRKQVAVVLPDCRVGGKLGRFHPDGEPVVHHAGFLRFDMANLSSGSTAKEPVEQPLWEGVHHFRNETLAFDLADAPTEMTLQTGLPAIERIAPALDLVKQERVGPERVAQTSEGLGAERSRLNLVELFGPDAPLAMRTILAGGSVKKKMGPAEWVFHPDALNPDGIPYEGEFATQVMWKRTVNHDFLDLVIAPFAGSTQQRLTLYPTKTDSDGPVLLLTIGNLCPENPLEWSEFPAPKGAREDRDFKWFYQLFRDERENPVSGLVPFPIRKGGGLGVDTCIGLRKTVPEFV